MAELWGDDSGDIPEKLDAQDKAVEDKKATEEVERKRLEFERSPQADAERRQRAVASQSAGGYRKRPSQQLTDTLSGVSR